MGQKCITAPLNRLLNKKKANGISSPSIVVIGKIVKHQIEECAPVPAYLSLSKFNNLISLSTEKECLSVEI
jgi:uroporphyrin-III C-methyltransferase